MPGHGVISDAQMKLDMNGLIGSLLKKLFGHMRVSQSNASRKQVHSPGLVEKLFYLFVACNVVLLHAHPTYW